MKTKTQLTSPPAPEGLWHASESEPQGSRSIGCRKVTPAAQDVGTTPARPLVAIIGVILNKLKFILYWVYYHILSASFGQASPAYEGCTSPVASERRHIGSVQCKVSLVIVSSLFIYNIGINRVLL